MNTINPSSVESLNCKIRHTTGYQIYLKISQLPVFSLYEQRRALQLQAIDTGETQLPTNTLALGQDTKIRIVYDKGEKDVDGKSVYYSVCQLCQRPVRFEVSYMYLLQNTRS